MSDQAKSSVLSQRSQPAECTRPSRKSSHPTAAVPSTSATKQPPQTASGRQTRSRLRSAQKTGKEAVPEEDFEELSTPEEPVSIEVDIAEPGTGEPLAAEPEAQVSPGEADSARPVEAKSTATDADQGSQAVKAVADSSAPTEEVALSERDFPESASATDTTQIAVEAETSVAGCVSESSEEALGAAGTPLPEEQKATSKREKTCTKCNFSCTSSSEFSRHLHQNHSENSQEQSAPSGTSPAISARRNSKRKSWSSVPESKMAQEKPVNGFAEECDGHLHEEDLSDDERLVICENPTPTRSSSVSVTPTRSGPIQNRTYTCPQCPDFTTTSARACLFHKKDTHHDNSIIYLCDICDYATKYKQKLPRHRKLHFEGQDPTRNMASRDLNDSISSNNSNRMVEPEDDDDLQEMDAVEEEIEDPNMSGNLPVYLPDNSGSSAGKKKGTRQEVDPAKYFTVVDEGKNKFACSSCGNIYKWRKSLNKHWKEKHSMEIPDGSPNPAGLLALVKQGSIEQTGPRMANKVGGGLADGHSPSQGHDSNRSTPLNPTQFHLPSLPALDRDSPDGAPLVTHTNTIGPFVTNTSQPVFPTATSTPLGLHRGMALFRSTITPTVDQKEPLDLSDKGAEAVSKQLKREPDWEPTSMDPSPQPSRVRPPKQPPLACNLCTFVGKTSVDYGNHVRTVHNNKKEFKCAACSEHFETSEELTTHFGETHYHEITAYKEMILRIPHGLQQTYHLINMSIEDIASLSTQDLNGSGAESRPLKCNICDYEAKWPADLQKHAVSHSEERPFACMVCGSTYKWKWDLVKHFDKSHERLPNPYKRKETSPAKPDDTGSEGASNDGQTADSSNASPPLLSNILADSAVSSVTAQLGNASILESSLLLVEPQPCTSQQASDLEDIDLANIQIPNVQSIITDVDNESRDAQQRPINAKTQRAVSETVRNRINQNVSRSRSAISSQRQGSNQQLTQQCPLCDYRARWPSEITQHMKNHSNEKPHGCPICEYRSKWKWDVVKHLKRCGSVNGDGRSYTIHDVVDHTRRPNSGPPNVTVNMQGVITTPSTSQHSPAGASAQPTQAVVTSVSPGAPGVMALHVAGSSPAQPVSLVMVAPTSTSPSLSQRPTVQSARPREGQHGSNACHQCSFVASSQAELRRHSVIHSNAKPWMCQHRDHSTRCEYSTRWKCDLKKHINAYRHQCPENEELLLLNFPQKCPHCNFHTTQRDSFEQHMHSHTTEGAQEKRESAGKYHCKICSETFTEMGDYLIHIKEHSTNPPAKSPPVENDVDEQRIKHPRKNMNVLKCSECTYITNSKGKLAIHVKEQHGTQCCPYCGEMIQQQDFLAHVSNHEEFIPEEWLLYIEDFAKCPESSEESKSLASAEESVLDAAQAEVSHRDMYKTASGATKRSREIVSCPYCAWDSDNILVLLKHIECKHPVELEDCRQRLKRRTPTPPGSQASSASCPFSGLENGSAMEVTYSPKRAIDLSVMASGNKGVSQVFGEASCPKNTLGPSGQAGLKKRPFQCTKCVFNTTNPTMYLRHVERHNSQAKHTCWYCNYSVDRMEHLYHHMRQVHPQELQEMGQMGTGQTDDDQPSSPSSSPDSSNQDEVQDDDVIHVSEESEAAAPTNPNKPKTMLAVGQATYKGVPVEVMVVDGERRFRCLQCDFLSPDLPATARHVQQHQVSQTASPSTSSGNPAAPFSASTTPTPTAAATGSPTLGPKFKRLNCKECPFTHSDVGVFSTHVAFHGANLEYQCPCCNFSVGDVGLLSRHVSVHDGQGETGARSSSAGATGTRDVNLPQQKSSSKKVNAASRVRYWCNMCPYNTTCKNNIKKHMKPHLVQSNYRCDQCNYSATRQYLLEQHKTYHECDPQVSFGPQDVVCDPYENESEVLDLPDDEEEEEGMDEEVDGHNGERQSRIHHCDNCPYSSKSLGEFKKHSSFHGANLQHKCDQCNYSAARGNLLTQHKLVHLDQTDGSRASDRRSASKNGGGKSKSTSSSPSLSVSDSSEGDLLHCHLCPFSTTIASAMDQHRSQHGSRLQFTCDYCNWSDKTLTAVLSHRFVHNQEPSFNVTPDQRIFSHQEIEVDEPQQESPPPSPPAQEQPKPAVATAKTFEPAPPKKTASGEYCCRICSFSTPNRAQYDLHARLHSSKNLKKRESRKRYRCNLCPYTSLSYSLVLHHMEKHQKSRVSASIPHRQKQEAASQDPQVHKEEEPIEAEEAAADFSCETCPFTATCLEELQAHKEGHEKEGPVRCMMCKFFTEAENDMVNHILAVHHQGRDREVVLQLVHASMDKNGLNKMEVETNNNHPSTKVPVVEIEQKGESPVVHEKVEDQKNEVEMEETTEAPVKEEMKVLKVYSCRVCDVDFTDKMELKVHEKSHDVESQ